MGGQVPYGMPPMGYGAPQQYAAPQQYPPQQQMPPQGQYPGAQAGAPGVMSDEDIAREVAQREKFRSNKDFQNADAVRAHLKNLGIEIYDKERSWKCSDGRSGVVPTFQEVDVLLANGGLAAAGGYGAPQGYAAAPQGYAAAAPQGYGAPQGYAAAPPQGYAAAAPQGYAQPTGGAPGAMSDEDIAREVAQRERFRASKDFPSADAVRTYLKGAGIEIYDKERSWKSNDGRSGVVPTFQEADALLAAAGAAHPPPYGGAGGYGA